MSKMAWECRRETELVMNAREGNFEAFDALVARYRPGAVLMARQIVNSCEQAEDAVQESFFSAYKALPQLADPGLFAHWLGAIVRHRSRRLASGDRRGNLPLDDLILAHVPSISFEVESRARSDAVRCAVAGLPDEIRTVVHLYYLDDWKVATIAEFLGQPVTTVKWRLHTGRMQLRKVLSLEMEESNGSGK